MTSFGCYPLFERGRLSRRLPLTRGHALVIDVLGPRPKDSETRRTDRMAAHEDTYEFMKAIEMPISNKLAAFDTKDLAKSGTVRVGFYHRTPATDPRINLSEIYDLPRFFDEPSSRNMLEIRFRKNSSGRKYIQVKNISNEALNGRDYNTGKYTLKPGKTVRINPRFYHEIHVPVTSSSEIPVHVVQFSPVKQHHESMIAQTLIRNLEMRKEGERLGEFDHLPSWEELEKISNEPVNQARQAINERIAREQYESLPEAVKVHPRDWPKK